MADKVLKIEIILPVREALAGLPVAIGKGATNNPAMPSEEAYNYTLNEYLPKEMTNELKSRILPNLRAYFGLTNPELLATIEPLYDEAVSCSVTFNDEEE